MGNCQRRVDSSVFTDMDGNLTKAALGDELWNDMNDSYGEIDYDDLGLESSAPCHSCNLLDESSLPFFLLASILGILASGAVLFALFRPLFHWQHCADRPVLAQLAVGSALFSIVLPILAPGLHGADSALLCHLAHLVWLAPVRGFQKRELVLMPSSPAWLLYGQLIGSLQKRSQRNCD
ncbi:Atypical chemokine receptor 1 [Galemys pyrenaicus]|uniref:Atypical chemokine receptor 1 n=1 Tax=Galemys pyrenaicus TaxID=202257 RepID=A0A8J5ZUJ0_GALPY|nr:Atypical chemokine receptor 1 [Galemys pyrenaicus]